jgi:hypothetical protein
MDAGSAQIVVNLGRDFKFSELDLKAERPQVILSDHFEVDVEAEKAEISASGIFVFSRKLDNKSNFDLSQRSVFLVPRYDDLKALLSERALENLIDHLIRVGQAASATDPDLLSRMFSFVKSVGRERKIDTFAKTVLSARNLSHGRLRSQTRCRSNLKIREVEPASFAHILIKVRTTINVHT